MTSVSMSREEFADKRKTSTRHSSRRLQGLVEAALAGGDVDPVTDELGEIYVEVYDLRVEALTAALTPLASRLPLNASSGSVRGALSHTTKDSSVPTTSLALANAVLNDATLSAYGADIEMEWVSMKTPPSGTP